MNSISFSAYYTIILGISILLNLILPFLKIYWYFAFSIKQIKENHQYWRLFTNYFVKPTKKVNLGTFIDIIYLYANLYNLEQSFQLFYQYAQFLMTILIICGLNITSTVLLYYFFNIKESRTLINELSYSLIALNSYKNPDGKTYIWFVAIKNKFAPIAIILMKIFINKDIYLDLIKSPLVGFVNGLIFAILTYKFNINFTPTFLKKLLNKDLTNKTLHIDINDRGYKFHYEDNNYNNNVFAVNFNTSSFNNRYQNYNEDYNDYVNNIKNKYGYFNNADKIEENDENEEKNEKDFFEDNEEREENDIIKNKNEKGFGENKEKEDSENIEKEKENIDEENKPINEEELKENIDEENKPINKEELKEKENIDEENKPINIEEKKEKIERELEEKNKENKINEENEINQVNEENESYLNKNHYKID